MRHRHVLSLIGLLLLALFIAACSPQQVEVTRVVTETEQVEVQVEVTRVVTETIEVEGQPVEVTRVVEVAPGPKYPKDTQLHILQWSHFVPQYDKWFDPLLRIGVRLTEWK